MKSQRAALLISLLPFLASAIPAPADINVPITDAEYASLYDGGLERRHAANVNQPITPAEWENLESSGLGRRDGIDSIIKRDKVMNCGHLVTGKGGSGGHGKWIPIAQFAQVADEFCKFG